MSEECVFCKIVSGQLPCAQVGESEKSWAFLDIMPVSEGHTLVIPKRHVKTLMELEEDERNDLFRLVQRVSQACLDGLGATGVNLLQANGQDAGQVVPHVHVHVLPRKEGDGLHFHPRPGRYEEGRMESVALRLRSRLQGGSV